MRTEVLCPSRAPLRPVKKPGDGLVRYWLALQGWRVGYVHDGVIYLPTRVHADCITEMLEVRWFPEAPRPLVGIYHPEEK